MAAVVQRHIEIVKRCDLADSGAGVAHPDFAHRIPAAGNGLPVFHEDRAEGHRKENIVLAHIIPDALRRVLRAEPLIQKIPGGGHEERVHTVVEGIAFCIVIGIKTPELAVPGQNTEVPVPVIVGVHRHNGIGLGGHDRRKVLTVRTIGVVGRFSAKLGGIGNLDLGEAAALSVDLLFPENCQDGIVQIVFDVPGIESAVEAGPMVKGDGFIRGQQAGGSGLLNDLKDFCSIVHADSAIAGRIGHRAGDRILGKRHKGLRCGGSRQKRQQEDQTQKTEYKGRDAEQRCGPAVCHGKLLSFHQAGRAEGSKTRRRAVFMRAPGADVHTRSGYRCRGRKNRRKTRQAP